MTDEQINAAIAKACGWTEIIHTPHDPQPPKGRESRGANWGKSIPNYCADLNAMAEAEKILGHILLYDYATNISSRHDWEDLLTASARQRAEAFLKTLGKWEEVQG